MVSDDPIRPEDELEAALAEVSAQRLGIIQKWDDMMNDPNLSWRDRLKACEMLLGLGRYKSPPVA